MSKKTATSETASPRFDLPSLPELLEAGVHFGHQSRRWHPLSGEFIFTKKNGIHIIDLEKTLRGLHEACLFLYQVAKDGGPIIFVGTKRQAREIVTAAAKDCGAFYVTERWLGGALTNFGEIEKNLVKLRNLRRDLEEGKYAKYTKREQSQLRQKLGKLEKLVGGIENLKERPAALFVVDIKREKTAVKEAEIISVPVVAIVDTNSDPSQITYPIPGNDDAIRSLKLLVSEVSKAVKKGYQEAGLNLTLGPEVEEKGSSGRQEDLPSLKESSLKPRVVKALAAAGITDRRQLGSCSSEDLSNIKGLGPKSLQEIQKLLSQEEI